MDGSRFDEVARGLWERGSRRSLVLRLGATPVLGGLAGLISLDADDEVEARKKNRDKHQRRHKRKRTCPSKAEICADRCGIVKYTCKKKRKKQGRKRKKQQRSVNCGACSCSPICPVCQICDEATDTCVPDPEQVGDPCGNEEGVCQADGTCVAAACTVCADGCEFSSVQAAIDDATPGDTIRVCAGTFEENLSIDKDLTIIGAGQGVDPGTNTILDGDGTDSVVRITAGSVVLRRLRITGGDSGLGGGGIHNLADLTVIDSTITGNTSSAEGGGIYADVDSTTTITGSTITGNSTPGGFGGGGISTFLATAVTLTNSTVSDNSSESGGGIFNYQSPLTLTGSTVSENEAATEGGGIYNSEGTLTLDNTTFSGNTAARNGGAIFNEPDSTVALTNGSSLTVNDADELGGGIFNNGILTLDDSSITNNIAGINGGGIFNQGAGGTGTSTCTGGSSVTGNEAPVGSPNQCAAENGGSCGTCI